MQILAASLERVTDTFLHAGYISAYPRAFDGHMYEGSHSAASMQLDVAEALRLSGETLAGAAPPPAADTTAAAAAAEMISWPEMLLATLAIFGGLALFQLMRKRLRSSRWRPLVPLGAAVAAVLAVFACESAPAPLPNSKPWEGVTVKEYANPSQATRVILNGIIADGVINVGQSVNHLGNIQNEVGLPTATPTEGMQYALQTYGLDGWGREFRVVASGRNYDVRSAGEDGVFDTADDMGVVVTQTDNESWEMARHAFFIRRVDGTTHLFLHRWSGDHFEYNHATEAASLTGGELFDYLTVDELDSDAETAVTDAYAQVAGTSTHDVLVLQVF